MARRGRAALHVARQLGYHGVPVEAIEPNDIYHDPTTVDFRFADDAVADGAEEILSNGAALSVFVAGYERSSPYHVRVHLAHLG